MDDPELTPQQETRVRALLAGARHDEPIPGDVADRLDRVLADLASAHDPESGPSLTDELAARRRRRAGTLLVAAAAVVLGGVAIAQVGPLGDDGAGDSLSVAEESTGTEGRAAEDGATLLYDSAGPEAADSDAAAGAPAAVAPPVPAPTPDTIRPLEVRPDRFAADAVRALAVGDRRVERTASRVPAWFTCDPAPWGPGHLVAVRYEGEPAVLAFREPAGETRVVDLLACGTAEVLRSATLPRS